MAILSLQNHLCVCSPSLGLGAPSIPLSFPLVEHFLVALICLAGVIKIVIFILDQNQYQFGFVLVMCVKHEFVVLTVSWIPDRIDLCCRDVPLMRGV